MESNDQIYDCDVQSCDNSKLTFFSHTLKQYNRKLLQAIIEKKFN